MNHIPRVIHYCWFGGKPLPDDVLKCINSWKRMCPDYQICQWDESNYDVEGCIYAKEAYQHQKWAFVSDYARFDILYTHGGIYMDTDVELIRPIEDILEKGPFIGTERRMAGTVSPGLGMAMPPAHPVCGEILDEYKRARFINPDGSYNLVSVVWYSTNVLKRYGLQQSDGIQNIQGVWVYPWDYFCPIDYKTGICDITSNTRSIHHYSASWLDEEAQKALRLTFRMSKYFGPKVGYTVGRIYSLPYRIKKKISELGLMGTARFCLENLRKSLIRK